VSKQATHHIHNLQVLERPPGKVNGSVMVRCEVLWNLEIWQRVDFVTDRESVEQRGYSFGRSSLRTSA
jgi:hypothetical protein